MAKLAIEVEIKFATVFVSLIESTVEAGASLGTAGNSELASGQLSSPSGHLMYGKADRGRVQDSEAQSKPGPCSQQTSYVDKMSEQEISIDRVIQKSAESDFIIVGESHNPTQEDLYYRKLVAAVSLKKHKQPCLFLEQDQRDFQTLLNRCNGDPASSARIARSNIKGSNVQCPGGPGNSNIHPGGLINSALSHQWKVFAVDDPYKNGECEIKYNGVGCRNITMAKRILQHKERHQCDAAIIVQGWGHLNYRWSAGKTIQDLLKPHLPKLTKLGLMTRDFSPYFTRSCASGWFKKQNWGQVVDPSFFNSTNQFGDHLLNNDVGEFDSIIWYKE